MSAYLFTSPRFRPLSISGEILPGATLTFYESGTTTPTDVYSDAGLTTPLTNPVVADASGEFPAIYLDPAVTYRALLHDEDAVLQWDIDPLAPARDFPPGTVMWFHGTEEDRDEAYPPDLWQVLDGNNGTPDGRDRVPIIAGGDHESGETGGSTPGSVQTSAAGAHSHGGSTGSHALTVSQMPEHHHRVIGDTNGATTATHGLGYSQVNSVAGRTANVSLSYIEDAGGSAEQLIEDTGGGAAHSHTISEQAAHTHTLDTAMPPYVALWALMRRSA